MSIISQYPATVKALSTLHPWVQREYDRGLHAAITEMFTLYPTKCVDWKVIVMEGPHLNEDGMRLSFTRTVQHGDASRHTHVKVGAYLKRHWPEVQDHLIRQVAGKYEAGGFEMTHDMEEIVRVIENGPYSCMRNKSFDKHPYYVYDPKFGWHMAVERKNDQIVGRALCLTHEGRKIFVRSYQGTPGDSGACANDRMNSWLKSQGYNKEDAWPAGAKLAYHPCPTSSRKGHPLLPYFDGSRRAVEVFGDREYLVMSQTDRDYEYYGGNTDGTPSVGNPKATCPCCGSRVSVNSLIEVGRPGTEQARICEACVVRDYTTVHGMVENRTTTYRVVNADVLRVDGIAWDRNHLSPSFVQLLSGDYTHNDNVVQIDGNHYLHTEVVRVGESDDYTLTGNAWKCHTSGLWFLNTDTNFVLDALNRRTHTTQVESEETEEA